MARSFSKYSVFIGQNDTERTQWLSKGINHLLQKIKRQLALPASLRLTPMAEEAVDLIGQQHRAFGIDTGE